MKSGNWELDLSRYFKVIHNENGIWSCMENGDVESRFSDETQDELLETEDTSWWFKYRANVIYHIAEKYFNKKQVIFDVGGGNGYTTWYMQNRGYLMALLEPTWKACRNAEDRGVRAVICGTLGQENVRDSSMGQIFMLDVLEHIENDTGFLRLMYEKLVPGGHVLLTVPAFRILWSSEDDAAGHYRRYTLDELKKKAEDVGFSVLYANYFFEFIFLPILLVRVGMEKAGLLKRSEERSAQERKNIVRKQFKERGGVVQAVLTILEKSERHRLMKSQKVRFGSSVICVLAKERGI